MCFYEWHTYRFRFVFVMSLFRLFPPVRWLYHMANSYCMLAVFLPSQWLLSNFNTAMLIPMPIVAELPKIIQNHPSPKTLSWFFLITPSFSPLSPGFSQFFPTGASRRTGTTWSPWTPRATPAPWRSGGPTAAASGPKAVGKLGEVDFFLGGWRICLTYPLQI